MKGIIMNKIIVKFDEEGNPSINVNGIKGKSCQDVTKFLEKELGKTISDTKTREYYETSNETIKLYR